ncbi:MAG: hypothetical protein AAFQ82_02585 [Myxococcota bacterium]
MNLLKTVVTERGGDPSLLDREYVWPIRAESTPSREAATSMSPLLTGSID